MKALLLAATIGVFLLGVAKDAGASETLRCEVLTIEASNSNQGIDPALSMYASIFAKAPFNGFNTFKLVQRKSYGLTLTTPVALSLPTPLEGRLKYNGESEGRLRLTLTIDRPNGTPVIVNGVASRGTAFFAAGFKSTNGRWIFGVNCNISSGVVSH